MTRAIPSMRFGHEAVVAAPQSGVQLGTRTDGTDGPVSLRLFRLLGTRVAVAGLVEAAQLIAIRSAAAGTGVQVLTARPQLWEPLLRFSGACRVLAPGEVVAPPGGPSLLVDDRPPAARSTMDRAPWQCVLDVRAHWGNDDLASFTYSDLTVFGSVPVQLVSAVASVFAIPRAAADQLAHVQPGSVAILRRGSAVLVGLNPTAAEYQLIEHTRTAPAQPAAPIWRH